LDHALAGSLGIEQAICLLGLVQPPTIGEELVNGHIVVDDELGALGLPLSRERPVEITGLPSLEWSRQIAHWLHDLIKERAHEIGCGLASDRSCVGTLAYIASAMVAVA
jgi:hypothetical protein